MVVVRSLLVVSLRDTCGFNLKAFSSRSVAVGAGLANNLFLVLNTNRDRGFDRAFSAFLPS